VIKEALAEIERMKTEILNLQGAAECPNCGESLEFDFSEIEDEDNED